MVQHLERHRLDQRLRCCRRTRDSCRRRRRTGTRGRRSSAWCDLDQVGAVVRAAFSRRPRGVRRWHRRCSTTIAMRRLAAASGSAGSSGSRSAWPVTSAEARPPAARHSASSRRVAFARSLDSSQLVRSRPVIRGGIGVAGDRDLLRQLRQHWRDLLQQQTRPLVGRRRAGREHRLLVLVHELDAQPLRRHVDRELRGRGRRAAGRSAPRRGFAARPCANLGLLAALELGRAAPPRSVSLSCGLAERAGAGAGQELRAAGVAAWAGADAAAGRMVAVLIDLFRRVAGGVVLSRPDRASVGRLGGARRAAQLGMRRPPPPASDVLPSITACAPRSETIVPLVERRMAAERLHPCRRRRG